MSTPVGDGATAEVVAPAPARGRPPARTGRRPARSPRAVGQKWTRRVHSWLSMTGFLVILFFATTGITLNHPTWFGASTPHDKTVTGTLPASTVVNGRADPLAISEYLRAKQGVTGQVTDHDETATGGTIDYDGPGVSATVDYTSRTGAYTLTTTTFGVVGLLNDLHSGQHTGPSFHWLIDISGGLLALVAATGLLLQLYIRRSRRVGLVLVGVGVVTAVALMVLNR